MLSELFGIDFDYFYACIYYVPEEAAVCEPLGSSAIATYSLITYSSVGKA